MAEKLRFTSHEHYLETAAPEARLHLERIRALVAERVPNAIPCIGYNMPAFRVGKIFFYFAAFKRHIGVYPPLKTDMELIELLKPYRGPKGNLSFRLDQPMPYELIGRVAEALAAEHADK